MTSSRGAWLLCIMILRILALTAGTAVFKVEMIGYTVANGKDWDNDCCDVVMWICAGQCDPIFTFCLDKLGGSTSPHTCAYKKQETDEYDDDNSISFNHNMNGVQNPIVYSFSTWPGGLKFKVLVEDHDSVSSHDGIDRFDYTIRRTPAKSRSEATWIEKLIYGMRTRSSPTSLKFRYQVYCSDHYFGSSCNIYCYPRDSIYSGHYTCDTDTGKKICLTGWEGVDCKIKTDYCLNHRCENGGTCVVMIDYYYCLCPDRFIGFFCEKAVTTTTKSSTRSSTTRSPLVRTPTTSPSKSSSTTRSELVTTPVTSPTTRFPGVVLETGTTPRAGTRPPYIIHNIYASSSASIPNWATGVIVVVSLLLVIICVVIRYKRMQKSQNRNDRPGRQTVLHGNGVLNGTGLNQPWANNRRTEGAANIRECLFCCEKRKARPGGEAVLHGNGVSNNLGLHDLRANNRAPPPSYSVAMGGHGRP